MTSPADTCPLVEHYAAACADKNCTSANGEIGERIADVRDRKDLADYIWRNALRKAANATNKCKKMVVIPIGLMGTLSATEPPRDIYPRWGGHCIHLVYHVEAQRMCLCDRNITTADEAAMEEYIADFLARGLAGATRMRDRPLGHGLPPFQGGVTWDGYRLPENHPPKYEVPPELLPYLNAMSVFDPAILDSPERFVAALNAVVVG